MGTLGLHRGRHRSRQASEEPALWVAASGLAMREEPAGGAAGTAGLAVKAEQCEAAIAAGRHQWRQASEEPAPWVAASGLAMKKEPAGGAVGTAGLAVKAEQWEAAWEASILRAAGPDEAQVPLPGQGGCTELAARAAGAAGAKGTAGTAGLAVPDGPPCHTTWAQPPRPQAPGHNNFSNC